MSKKQKRQSTRTFTPVVATPRPVSTPNRPAVSTEFNPDYSYVIRDLKKIGILAISFITILVVLTFFLR